MEEDDQDGAWFEQLLEEAQQQVFADDEPARSLAAVQCRLRALAAREAYEVLHAEEVA